MKSRILGPSLLAALVPGILSAIQVGARAYGISNFIHVNSNLQAPGHPGVFISFERTGTDCEVLEDSLLHLPASVLANPQSGQSQAHECTVQLGHATVSMGSDDAGISTMRENEPPSVAPNLPAIRTPQDQCPASVAPAAESIFEPQVCPDQSKVGTARIHTPLLPYV